MLQDIWLHTGVFSGMYLMFPGASRGWILETRPNCVAQKSEQAPPPVVTMIKILDLPEIPPMLSMEFCQEIRAWKLNMTTDTDALGWGKTRVCN